MKHIYAVLPLLFFISLSVFSQEDIHPVDQKFIDCQDENGYGDQNVLECLGQSMENWDVQLNQVYNEIRGIVSEDYKNALKDSQLKWLAYRDAEYRFIESQYEGLQGTMYPAIIIRGKLMILKHRVLELETYYRALPWE